MTTVYVTTNIPIEYQIFIDGQIQSFGLGTHYKILNVSQGKKTLSIKTNTPSHQTPKIDIATSGNKEEYYIINKDGDKYVLAPCNSEFKMRSDINPILCSYIPKRAPVRLDSNYKQVHSCKISDSFLNNTILRLDDLKDKNARQIYLENSFKNKCLMTHQVRSIGYRIEDEQDRYNFYLKYYRSCVDRIEYNILLKTFNSQVYANKFDEWLKKQ